MGPGDRSVGLVRQDSMLSAANPRIRLCAIKRMDASRRPNLTLVLTDSEQDTRRSVKALADSSPHDARLVARTADLIAAGPATPVFEQGGYGFPEPPTIAPGSTWARSWPGSRDVSPHTRSAVHWRRDQPPTLTTPECQGCDAKTRRAA